MAISSSKGEFKRKTSQFGATIPSADHPPESGRYALYISYGCPWAHRANITRSLKRLDDIIERVELDGYDVTKGWHFIGKTGHAKDPITGVETLRQLYLQADPACLDDGIASVPVLWDRKKSQWR